MVTKEPFKVILYIVFKHLFLNNELGDPYFLFLKSDKQAKNKLWKVLKILWSGFIAIFTSGKFKGGSLQRVSF